MSGDRQINKSALFPPQRGSFYDISGKLLFARVER